MGIDEVSAKLGKHDAQLEAIQHTVNRTEDMVTCLVAEHNRNKGSRRAMIATATAVSALVGTTVSAAIAFFKH